MIGADEFVEMLRNSTLETLGQVNFFNLSRKIYFKFNSVA